MTDTYNFVVETLNLKDIETFQIKQALKESKPPPMILV